MCINNFTKKLLTRYLVIHVMATSKIHTEHVLLDINYLNNNDNFSIILVPFHFSAYKSNIPKTEDLAGLWRPDWASLITFAC